MCVVRQMPKYNKKFHHFNFFSIKFELNSLKNYNYIHIYICTSFCPIFYKVLPTKINSKFHVINRIYKILHIFQIFFRKQSYPNFRIEISSLNKNMMPRFVCHRLFSCQICPPFNPKLVSSSTSLLLLFKADIKFNLFKNIIYIYIYGPSLWQKLSRLHIHISFLSMCLMCVVL